MKASELPDPLPFEDLPVWGDDTSAKHLAPPTATGEDPGPIRFSVDEALNRKVCLWRGDQLALRCDVVVNATSEQFSDRSPLTRRIMTLAGEGEPPQQRGGFLFSSFFTPSQELSAAIARLDGCRTGEAKLTPAFNLHSRYIIHTGALRSLSSPKRFSILSIVSSTSGPPLQCALQDGC